VITSRRLALCMALLGCARAAVREPPPAADFESELLAASKEQGQVDRHAFDRLHCDGPLCKFIDQRGAGQNFQRILEEHWLGRSEEDVRLTDAALRGMEAFRKPSMTPLLATVAVNGDALLPFRVRCAGLLGKLRADSANDAVSRLLTTGSDEERMEATRELLKNDAWELAPAMRAAIPAQPEASYTRGFLPKAVEMLASPTGCVEYKPNHCTCAGVIDAMIVRPGEVCSARPGRTLPASR
jgi:hypothetical protein